MLGINYIRCIVVDFVSVAGCLGYDVLAEITDFQVVSGMFQLLVV